jgi:hypothetical protein
VVTETGSGTRAISQAVNGTLVITNAAADNDVNSFQKSSLASGAVAEQFKWVSGKKLYFGARFKVSDDDQIDFFFGLSATLTTPIASGITDGMGFRKDDGDTYIDLVNRKNAATTGDDTAAATVTADTFMVLEAYYDGTSDYIQFFKDGVNIGNSSIDYVNDDEEMAVTFAVQNGEAVAKIMTMDWIRVVAER